MADKNTFVVYNDLDEQTRLLTDAQMGQLFRAMLQFSKGKDPAPADSLVMMAFSFVRPSMERDAAKYKQTCEKRKAAGAKGGRPKKQTKQEEPGPDFFSPKSKRLDKPTKEPDNVHDNENDNDNDNVHVNVNVPLSQGVKGEDEDPRTPDEDAKNAQEAVENPVENDVQDVVNYCKKCGLTINHPQRRQLAQFVKKVGFDVAVLAVDRAMVHGANSAAYPLAILAEWDRLGLHDVEAVENHLEGEVVA